MFLIIVVINFTRKNQTEKYWSNVLGDLLKIAEYCFPSLPVAICYEVKLIIYIVILSIFNIVFLIILIGIC